MWKSKSRIRLFLASCIAVAAAATAQEPPQFSMLPKYQTPVPYAGVRNWHLTQNLGPTGARGWIHGHDPRHANTHQSREILIKSVEELSPADGILRPYDIIVGVPVAAGGEPVPFAADARLCASADLGAFEGGHTGNFFNQLWTPLGVAVSGRDNTQRFWSRFNSYRDLARRADGSFITQPLPHHREGDLSEINYIRMGGPGLATGAFALSYLAANDSLAILGRKRSVFGGDVPDALAPALALYRQKRFDECRLEALKLVGEGNPLVKDLAGQLHRAAGRNMAGIALVLEAMQARLDAGDLLSLKHQLDSTGAIIEPADPRLARFRDAVDNPDNAAIMLHGQNYYAAALGYSYTGRRGFTRFIPRSQDCGNGKIRGTMTELAGSAQGFYQKRAAAWLAANPPLPATSQVELVARLDAAEQPEVRQVFAVADPAKITELLLTWDLSYGAAMRILLNDTTIMDLEVTKGQWRTARDTLIPLTPAALELLRQGENVLAIQRDPAKPVNFANCRLEAVVTP